MKKAILFTALLSSSLSLFAQTSCDQQFKRLLIFSKKDKVSDTEFLTVLQMVKKMELQQCSDYVVSKNGEVIIDETLASLFGKICLTGNSRNAIKAYIEFVKRNMGSADEEMSILLEKLFVKHPQYVLSIVGYDKDLLNQLEWGFVNNHGVTSKNYKTVFFGINPEL